MKRKPLLRGKPLRRSGKKTQLWQAVRQWLQREFENRGITHCEFSFIKHDCWRENVAFAHCKKRRLLLDGEIWHVAVACQNVHKILDEQMSHAEMEIVVHRAIDARGLIAP